MEQEDGTAWVVATGALTNVALLFACFPELVERIRGLSIMGGAVGGGFTGVGMGMGDGDGERVGNWTRWAEFNIYVRVCLFILCMCVGGWGRAFFGLVGGEGVLFVLSRKGAIHCFLC